MTLVTSKLNNATTTISHTIGAPLVIGSLPLFVWTEKQAMVHLEISQNIGALLKELQEVSQGLTFSILSIFCKRGSTKN